MITPSPSGATPARAPVLPEGLRSLAASTLWAAVDLSVADGGRWTVGRFDGARTILLFSETEAEVRVDFDRVVISRRAEETWVLATADPGTGKITELYRTDRFPSAIPAATMDRAGSVLFFSGLRIGPGEPIGLYRFDLATGDVTELLKGEGDGGRSMLDWSPSGQTLAWSVCGQETCDVDVVDAESGAARRVSHFVLQATSDRYLLGYPDRSDLRWHLYDLRTDRRQVIAEDYIAAAYDGYAIDDAGFLMYGLDRYGDPDRPATALQFVVHDTATGADRLVLRLEDASRRLYRFWRSDRWAVLGGSGGLSGAVTNGESFDVLDLSGGTVLEGALPTR